jgi:CDP-diacylglycerol--glycerol-3-phosphate 3-phosphatidyltransferase
MSALVLLSVEFNRSVMISYFAGFGEALGLFVLISTILILAREFIITGFRTIAVRKNIVLAADKIGKMKTVTQMISIVALLLTGFAFSCYPAPNIGEHAVFPIWGVILLSLGLVSLIVAVLLTVISAVNYIVKNRSVLK